MTEEFDVELLDRITNGYVPAKLIKKPHPEVLVRAEEHWRGWMQGAATVNHWHNLGLTLPYDHSHWQWGYKAQRAAQVLSEEIYVIRRLKADGIDMEAAVEGMMHLSTTAIRCRHPAHPGSPGIYLDLVAAAPWNLPGLAQSPRYGLVGTTLMVRALMVSREMGMRGRLGLHALAGAAPWYKKLGMVSLGHDPAKENLEYFEFDEDAAEVFYPAEGDIDE